MTRNFGLMSGRPAPWGHSGSQPSTSSANTTRADSNIVSFRLIPQTLESRLQQIEESQARLDALELGSRVFFSVFLFFAWVVPWLAVIAILRFR